MAFRRAITGQSNNNKTRAPFLLSHLFYCAVLLQKSNNKMNYKVKIMMIRHPRKLDYLVSKLKKDVLSNFETEINGQVFPIIENDAFNTADRKHAIRIKKFIDKSGNFRGKIYCEIRGIFLPFPFNRKRTKKDIAEILSLTTERKEGGNKNEKL